MKYVFVLHTYKHTSIRMFVCVCVCTGSFFKNMFTTKSRTPLFESCSSGANKMFPGNRNIKTGPLAPGHTSTGPEGAILYPL